ncbi:ABC-2 transporter permease [Enterococcus casseliflavus]|uniref:ABC-2 transporter permease n=1 Tax=Enterococcus casseliflavus TaxID=37734 RepID=UPI001883EE95|nr:ABC-2 transporter permease [Enterococcus casseliflavus]MBE9908971.1 ABC-2 transporter permease [Enterococcus casseliflavus]
MKGLLLTKFFLVYRSFFGYLFISMLISLLLIFLQVEKAAQFSIMIIILLSSMPSLEVIKQEGISNFNIYTFTLPVSRSSMVKSNYVFYLFSVLIGICISFLVYIISIRIDDRLIITNILFTYSSIFLVVMIAGSVVYPLLYFLGHEKSDGIVIGGAFAGLAMLFAVQVIMGELSSYIASSTFDQSIYTLGIFGVISILLYCSSYFVSKLIFIKKDY